MSIPLLSSIIVRRTLSFESPLLSGHTAAHAPHEMQLFISGCSSSISFQVLLLALKMSIALLFSGLYPKSFMLLPNSYLFRQLLREHQPKPQLYSLDLCSLRLQISLCVLFYLSQCETNSVQSRCR